MKTISILGSTGSIGVSTLKVAEQYSDRLRVAGLACGNNQKLLARQVRQFRPVLAAVANGSEIQEELKAAAKESGTELMTGPQGQDAVATLSESNVVVAGVLGAAGLKPVIAAVRAGKRVALANKEAMVLAGELMLDLCRKHGGELLPVDSEHSAIFQCLQGQRREDLGKILLSASGGPFRTYDAEKLADVTVEEALDHPRWKMGRKITIDSATLMNKALEIIEARWLFQVEPEQIEVVVHPQCIVHSMVELVDGTVMAQLGRTDMMMPIQYAISYPERWPNESMQISLPAEEKLEFFEPDRKKFPSLDFAYEALRTGGTMPAILNAADEIAVASFLDGSLSFGGIFKVIEQTMKACGSVAHPDLEDIFAADRQARSQAEQYVKKLSN